MQGLGALETPSGSGNFFSKNLHSVEIYALINILTRKSAKERLSDRTLSSADSQLNTATTREEAFLTCHDALDIVVDPVLAHNPPSQPPAPATPPTPSLPSAIHYYA